jgi:hypothetical protein
MQTWMLDAKRFVVTCSSSRGLGTNLSSTKENEEKEHYH